MGTNVSYLISDAILYNLLSPSAPIFVDINSDIILLCDSDTYLYSCAIFSFKSFVTKNNAYKKNTANH